MKANPTKTKTKPNQMREKTDEGTDFLLFSDIQIIGMKRTKTRKGQKQIAYKLRKGRTNGRKKGESLG